jgi:sugar/nucleoside kinase (ribokinase family)
MPAAGHQAPSWDVVGLGANSIDSVYLLPRGPRAGDKMRIAGRLVCCGGQVATALATCARFGLRTKYVGALGGDDNGARMRDELTRRGIDVEDAPVRDAPNPVAVILVDQASGERVVLWDRDERLRLGPGEPAAASILPARVLHVDDVDLPAALRSARLARDRGVPVTSDIERTDEGIDELIAAVTYPILAEQVPAALTGEADPERALRKLRRLNSGLLCVTLGARGAIALDGDRLLHLPGFPAEARDTTGAGDVFRGAFICALLEGRGAGDILRFANAAAAVSCTRVGAMNGVPSREETLALLAPGWIDT